MQSQCYHRVQTLSAPGDGIEPWVLDKLLVTGFCAAPKERPGRSAESLKVNRKTPFVTPGEVEIYGYFRAHLGPRFHTAGLRVQFHYNQSPGIHFKVEPPEEYRESILLGLQEGMALRFPEFPQGGSLWITEITDDPVASSRIAFHQAGRMVIEQAYFCRAFASKPIH